MARIAGINLPNEKRIEVALTAIHGIGRKLSATILGKIKLDANKKAKDLTEADLDKLREEISHHLTEGDLKRKVQMDVKHQVDVGSYIGTRHKKGLPVRGQGTKKNSRTRKGKRKTVANKKMATK